MSYSYRSRRAPASVRRNSRGRTGSSHNRRGQTAQYIDPSRYILSAATTASEVYAPKHKFTDFDISPRLKANLEAKGYKTPTPIQDQTIPPALNGRDIIGIASTGTGKTAAFALPILERLSAGQTGAALVVVPTRELAQQIEEEFRALARGSNLRSAVIIGGSSMRNQLRDLRFNPRIVIGTPGRVKDHLQRRTLRLSGFNMIVLDEVDRMLDMGFIHDVKAILAQASPQRQSFFFSATMDERVRSLIHNFTKDPFTVLLKTRSTSESVHQDVVRYQGNSDRMNKLHDILLKDEVAKAIVFDQTQRGVQRLSNELIARGFPADAIHGGKSQGQRQRALARFKKNDIRILVATDVAARGIDVVDITHVINFSVPKIYDDYIHRVGRTGRAGQIGYALTFVAN